MLEGFPSPFFRVTPKMCGSDFWLVSTQDANTWESGLSILPPSAGCRELPHGATGVSWGRNAGMAEVVYAMAGIHAHARLACWDVTWNLPLLIYDGRLISLLIQLRIWQCPAPVWTTHTFGSTLPGSQYSLVHQGGLGWNHFSGLLAVPSLVNR